MSEKIKYAGLNLPESLIEELKVWKMAHAMAYGKNISYAEMIRSMLDRIPKDEPLVSQAMSKMLEMNPELKNRMGIL